MSLNKSLNTTVYKIQDQPFTRNIRFRPEPTKKKVNGATCGLYLKYRGREWVLDYELCHSVGFSSNKSCRVGTQLISLSTEITV